MGSKRKRPESKLIFISHNRRDKELAREIALFLTSENINVWFDEWEISAGDSIIDQINRGLEGCTHFIIVWSRHAKTSNWVTSELKSAMTKAIKTRAKKCLIILIMLPSNAS